MPIPLGNGVPIVTIPDNYDPPTGGPATLGPIQTMVRVQFVVSQYSVFIQLASGVDPSGRPIFDPTEIPFTPGIWTIDNCAGLRFRNAVAGLSAIVSAVGYLEGDPLPLAVSKAASGKLNSVGGITDAPTITVFNTAGNFVYNPPVGCTGVFAEVYGAGGGSGGVAAAGAGLVAVSAGGGGGGYAGAVIPLPLLAHETIALRVVQVLVTSFTVIVGAGGLGGAAGANDGFAGGDSKVITIGLPLNPTLLAGNGGGLGQGSGAVGTAPQAIATGGVGGGFSIYGGGNPVNEGQIQGYGIPGMYGGHGIALAITGVQSPGGGGGSAKGGAGTRPARGAGPGIAGTQPGGGASGAAGNNGNAAAAGANGGDGLVVFTEFYD